MNTADIQQTREHFHSLLILKDFLYSADSFSYLHDHQFGFRVVLESVAKDLESLPEHLLFENAFETKSR